MRFEPWKVDAGKKIVKHRSGFIKRALIMVVCSSGTLKNGR